jgi:putative addiction module component (TIGR02574 family)
MNKRLLDELLELTPAERIELVEVLWDSVTPDDMPPLTDEQIRACEHELAEHRADPSSSIPWEEAKQWLRARLK